MTQVKVPPKQDAAGNIGLHLRCLAEESNDQDNRLAAIEQAITRIEAALKHFEQKQ